MTSALIAEAVRGRLQSRRTAEAEPPPAPEPPEPEPRPKREVATIQLHAYVSPSKRGRPERDRQCAQCGLWSRNKVHKPEEAS